MPIKLSESSIYSSPTSMKSFKTLTNTLLYRIRLSINSNTYKARLLKVTTLKLYKIVSNTSTLWLGNSLITTGVLSFNTLRGKPQRSMMHQRATSSSKLVTQKRKIQRSSEIL